ncbi:MAG: alanine--tRNA ligase [Nanoarchaeota archaeon]|nr:alanine--tRNA ligase [Nanoarchaeota archaeon]
MNRKQLIKKYIEFFKSRDHSQIQNLSLIPENNPTVLFTTAGMHPLVPFLLGEPHPQGKRLVNVQRCIRTGDIDEVGDTTHHTFFEMLGNWSLGDYFKEDAIKMTFKFHTKILEIPIERYAVTCFGGNKNAPKDEESAKVWQSIGIPKERIAFLEDNWWETTGVGPCGPDTEMFFWKDNSIPAPKTFDPENENWVEIGNDVLMQYQKDKEGNYNLAKQKNIDFGGGVERTITILNGLEDNYLADIWQPIIKQIEKLSKKTYQGNEKEMRIIADHIKAAVFIIADGVTPSNTEQGYILRRLIRRAIRYAKNLDIPKDADLTTPLVKEILKIYDDYQHLQTNKQTIIDELNKEEEAFEKTLEKGLRVFNKNSDKDIDGKTAFLLFQSYGFPIEMTMELAKEKNIQVDRKDFEKEFDNHQTLSRTASAGKFKSGLADNSEATTKLHTACHLLNQALRVVLKNPNIFQKGANITAERLRFDFNLDRKLTSEEKQQIGDLINKKIQEAIPVELQELTTKEAKTQGAQGIFDDKYGDKVKVYTIGNFSKEICAGPHVKNTSELGNFKITKEESSGSGVRRIKAILE